MSFDTSGPKMGPRKQSGVEALNFQKCPFFINRVKVREMYENPYILENVNGRCATSRQAF